MAGDGTVMSLACSRASAVAPDIWGPAKPQQLLLSPQTCPHAHGIPSQDP